MEIIQGDIKYKVVDGVLKGWIGTSPFKKPLYNGSIIVEGWTQVDEDAKTENEAKQLKQELIDKGVTVGDFHFSTITDINNFVTQKNELEKLGLTEMGWNDINDNWVTLSIEDAQNIFLQASIGFQNIYKS